MGHVDSGFCVNINLFVTLEMHRNFLILIAILIQTFLVGCASSLHGGHAVVDDQSRKRFVLVKKKGQATPILQHSHHPVKSRKPNQQKYTVKRGDTAYSIAFKYGLDVKQLALMNHLGDDFAIGLGQQLIIFSNTPKVPKKSADKITIGSDTMTDARAKVKEKNNVKSIHNEGELKRDFNFIKKSVQWRWPAKGKVIHYFSLERGGNKGLDITGVYADSIRAASDGTVVYSGSGLRGYGNLIIIKHDDHYLSAYAYNKELLVTEGMVVKAGQVIAKMGKITETCPMLHFEIRFDGKPINPLPYLR